MDRKYVAIEHLAEERLRAARRERGMTQIDLADQMAELGFPWSQPTVARVERGRRRLSLAEAHALMDILEQNQSNFYRRIDSLASEGE
jgi:transcriptional regulator with XRE-family HTH domain